MTITIPRVLYLHILQNSITIILLLLVLTMIDVCGFLLLDEGSDTKNVSKLAEQIDTSGNPARNMQTLLPRCQSFPESVAIRT